jgi:hypothetical protein
MEEQSTVFNQNHLRNRLLEVLRRKPRTLKHNARCIGVAIPTLKQFLLGGHVEFLTLMKISNFIECKENLITAQDKENESL